MLWRFQRDKRPYRFADMLSRLRGVFADKNNFIHTHDKTIRHNEELYVGEVELEWFLKPHWWTKIKTRVYYQSRLIPVAH